MNPRVHLSDQYADVLKLVVCDRVGSVRPEGDRNARVMLEVVEECNAVAQGLVSVASAGDGKVQYRDGDLRAHAILVY